MIAVLRLTTLVLLFCCSLTQAAEQDEVSDFFTARWFDIEIIVFERLNVLDMHTDEQLTLHAPREWPANTLEMLQSNSTKVNQRSLGEQVDEAWIPQTDARCFGFPYLREQDPIHPLLLPESEFSDQGTDSDDRTAQSPDDETGSAIDPGTLPPINTPQLELSPYLQFLADVAEFETSLQQESLTWRTDLQMIEHVKSINRQNTLRPILHRRWRQAVPPRDQPQPIYLRSPINEDSPLTATGFAKVEGYVAVTVARYLHFAPTLWYHADTLGGEPIPVPFDQSSQSWPTQDGKAYMRLSESRRVRSGNLHYLDHPKLGVIVRIDPIEIPAHLDQAWQDIQASEE